MGAPKSYQLSPPAPPRADVVWMRAMARAMRRQPALGTRLRRCTELRHAREQGPAGRAHSVSPPGPGKIWKPCPPEVADRSKSEKAGPRSRTNQPPPRRRAAATATSGRSAGLTSARIDRFQAVDVRVLRFGDRNRTQRIALDLVHVDQPGPIESL